MVMLIKKVLVVSMSWICRQVSQSIDFDSLGLIIVNTKYEWRMTCIHLSIYFIILSDLELSSFSVGANSSSTKTSNCNGNLNFVQI